MKIHVILMLCTYNFCIMACSNYIYKRKKGYELIYFNNIPIDLLQQGIQIRERTKKEQENNALFVAQLLNFAMDTHLECLPLELQKDIQDRVLNFELWVKQDDLSFDSPGEKIKRVFWCGKKACPSRSCNHWLHFTNGAGADDCSKCPRCTHCYRVVYTLQTQNKEWKEELRKALFAPNNHYRITLPKFENKFAVKEQFCCSAEFFACHYKYIHFVGKRAVQFDDFVPYQFTWNQLNLCLFLYRWLLVEKPIKSFSMEVFFNNILWRIKLSSEMSSALFFYLKNTWNSFPQSAQNALWQRISSLIQSYGKSRMISK